MATYDAIRTSLLYYHRRVTNNPTQCKLSELFGFGISNVATKDYLDDRKVLLKGRRILELKHQFPPANRKLEEAFPRLLKARGCALSCNGLDEFVFIPTDGGVADYFSYQLIPNGKAEDASYADKDEEKDDDEDEEEDDDEKKIKDKVKSAEGKKTTLKRGKKTTCANNNKRKKHQQQEEEDVAGHDEQLLVIGQAKQWSRKQLTMTDFVEEAKKVNDIVNNKILYVIVIFSISACSLIEREDLPDMCIFIRGDDLCHYLGLALADQALLHIEPM